MDSDRTRRVGITCSKCGRSMPMFDFGGDVDNVAIRNTSVVCSDCATMNKVSNVTIYKGNLGIEKRPGDSPTWVNEFTELVREINLMGRMPTRREIERIADRLQNSPFFKWLAIILLLINCGEYSIKMFVWAVELILKEYPNKELEFERNKLIVKMGDINIDLKMYFKLQIGFQESLAKQRELDAQAIQPESRPTSQPDTRTDTQGSKE